MEHYDVIYIGSGHAAWHGALILRMFNQRVAIIEKGLLGGTCTNYGCDAKILLDSPFLLKEGLERYMGIGLNNKIDIDWNKLMHYKQEVIAALPDGLSAIFDRFGIDLISGEGSFKNDHIVTVNGVDYSAKNFVIATGQRYMPLDIEGKEYTHDSKDFLNLVDIPNHVTFIGAGIISMEFASLCLSLGKKVDIIEVGNRALNMYPEEYVNNIILKMKEQGANFYFLHHVNKVERVRNSEYRIYLEEGEVITTNYVVVAAGREANIDGLGLDKLGINYSPRGIKVDSHLRTNAKHIYASGDVIDKDVPKLTPTAEFESNYIAIDILLAFNKKIKYPVIPHLVFTLPRIGVVGVSIDEANKHPNKYRIERVKLGEMFLWLNKNEKDEEITYIFDKRSRLVGASVYSDEAGSYLDILTIIINLKLDYTKLSGMIFSFPTQTYGLISNLISLMLKK